MKRSKFVRVFALFVIVAGIGALVLRLALTPAPHKHLTASVDVPIEKPPVAEQPIAPQGEERQMAGSIVPALPEHEIVPPPGHKPQIAIVIDDMGLNLSGSQHAIKLPATITLSFMPYAERLDEQTAAAREAGHELMLHMPMEPMGHEDPGPGALLTTLPPAEIRARLDHALDSFEGFDGINNHMGSRFTADTAGMQIVAEELSKRHLFFLDSRTSAQTVGFSIVQKEGLPAISRDVFLDDSLSPAAIHLQLAATERAAQRKGYAVAIGHPHDETLKAIEAWLPEAEKDGFEFVPVHDLVKTQVIKVNGP